VNFSALGYKAVINGTHLGLLYKDEVFQSLRPGDRIKGFIKAIREDRKIDLSLQPRAQQAREELTDRYGVSKGNYKKALGALYKQRLISVSKDEIKLLVK